jgi:hypothetical protein
MKTMTKTLTITFSLYLLTLAGCGTLVKPVQVANRDLSQWAVDDPNIIELKIIKDPDGAITYRYNAEFKSDPVNTIPFWDWEYNFLKVPVVRGQINGKTYPMAFDTGNSINAIVIEDIHIRDNKLPVFFFQKPNDSVGMALVSDFEIGSLIAQNTPCIILKNHTAIKFLGIPVGRSRHVIIHLQLMTRFKYFEFDQIEKKVRFSPEHSFEPEDPGQWLSFPFVIEDNRILLTAELENIETTWFLDTGHGGQFELGEPLMVQLLQKRPDLKQVRKRNTWYYAPYGDGRSDGKAITVKNLRLGKHTLNRVNIVYDIKCYEDEPYQGMIGFELFEDTMMVLDFEKNLLWVKKAKGSRFEE